MTIREPEKDEPVSPPDGPDVSAPDGGGSPARSTKAATTVRPRAAARRQAPAKGTTDKPADRIEPGADREPEKAARPMPRTRKRPGRAGQSSDASAATGDTEALAAPAALEVSPPPALSVARLSFSYGTRKVLDEVSFRIEAGQFTALLGPNGAGKTTLFSLITRLFDSGDGSIRIMGRDPKEHGATALAPLGVVFQSETLDLDLTVRQNLHYFAALHGLRARTAEARMLEELEAIGLSEKIDVRVRELNGGHRRRVEIARALLHSPDLLLLDEATVGLDVPSRKAIVARVHALARERRIGVLWTTHLIDEVEPDDALVVLHKGRIVASGPTSEVVARTRKPTLAEAFDQLTRATAGPEEARG